MGDLVIDFVFMFLLVKKNKPVVLVPQGTKSAPHVASISGSALATSQRSPTKTDVCFRYAPNPAPEVPSVKNTQRVEGDDGIVWPDPGFLLDVPSVPPGAKSRGVDKAYLNGPCSAKLHLRIALPRGRFTAVGPYQGIYATSRWNIVGPKGRRLHHLTDQMQFVCSLKAGYTYYLVCNLGQAGEQFVPLSPNGDDGDICLAFKNSDDIRRRSTAPAKRARRPSGTTIPLYEYRALYSLMVDYDANWPVPEGQLLSYTGDDVAHPICGGGQSGGS